VTEKIGRRAVTKSIKKIAGGRRTNPWGSRGGGAKKRKWEDENLGSNAGKKNGLLKKKIEGLIGAGSRQGESDCDAGRKQKLWAMCRGEPKK